MALVFASLVDPEFWWGIHWLAFLPTELKVGFLLLAAVPFLLLIPSLKIDRLLSKSWAKWSVFSLLLLGALFMFDHFPIVMDMYGNAYQYVGFRNEMFTAYPEQAIDELLTFELVPSAGRKTILHSYTVISYYAELEYGTIFKWAGLIFEFLFIGLWIWFVHGKVKQPLWQIMLVIIGIFAPLTQVFYDHTETYAPCFFAMLLWLVLMVAQVRSRNSKLLWMLAVLYLINVKMHPVTVLLGPALALAFVYQYASSRSSWLFTWKGLSGAIIAPIFLMGAVLYFFILHDYDDPRFLEGVTDAERVFLPLLSPAPPLDRYNLLSLNHIADYANMMLHWSIPAWLIVAGGLVIVGAKRLFHSVESKLIFLTLLLFASFFFVFNPLLSMPMDWDVFSFPAIVLLVLSVLVVEQIQDERTSKILVPAAISLQVLLIPMFLVNADKKMLSQRLEKVGVHVFKTYYLHSTRILFGAWNMTENVDEYFNRKRAIEDELQPFALLGNDPKYANLLMDDGFYYLRYGNDPAKALGFLREALRYNPSSVEIQELLREAQANVNR